MTRNPPGSPWNPPGIPHRIPSWKITRHMQETISMYFDRHTCWQTWLNASLRDGNSQWNIRWQRCRSHLNPLSTPSSVYLNTSWAESAYGIFDGNGATPLSIPSQPPLPFTEILHGLNQPMEYLMATVPTPSQPPLNPLFRLLKYFMG